MVFQRDARTVQVQGAVHAQQTTHELTAESLLLELDAAFHARHLVASGHPRFRDSDVQGPMALDADEISAGLTPEGSVESIVASGNVHGQPKHTRRRGWDRGRTRPDGPGDAPERASSAYCRRRRHFDVARCDGAAGRAASKAKPSKCTSCSKVSRRGEPGPALLESVNTLAPARVEWQNIVDGRRKARQANDAHEWKADEPADSTGRINCNNW